MDEIKTKLEYLSTVNGQRKDDARFHKLINKFSHHGIVYMKSSDENVTVLGQFENFFGIKARNRKEFLQILDSFEDENKDDLMVFINSISPDFEVKEYVCKLVNENKWYRFTCHAVYEEERCTDKLIFIHDVTKDIEQRNSLERVVYYDELTGLYNRNYFIHLLIKMCEKAEQEMETVSVMIIDIDDFKKVNDGMGIIAGDDLINQFGAFLDRFNDGRVIASRFNNDVFCIAIYAPNDKVNVQTIYDEIESRNDKPYFLASGNTVEISVTAGVAEYPQASKNPLELVNFAEVIMYKGKNGGKRVIRYFDAASYEKFMHDIEIENILKKALLNKSFTLFFQPQYSIVNGTLRGFEVLCRLFLEEGGQISPGEFIPIAEKTGLIIDIGAFIFEESIKQYVIWKNKYNIEAIISINISVAQFDTKNFVNFVRGTVDKYGISPENVELEITESMFINDMSSVLEKIDLLRECGFKISLDDFGTGYSSFSYLNKLNIDTVKIDKSFIDNIENDLSTRIVVRYMIDMIHELGFEIIAEGVEEDKQQDFLKRIGCDVIQGYLLGRPVNSATMEEIIKERI